MKDKKNKKHGTVVSETVSNILIKESNRRDRSISYLICEAVEEKYIKK